MCDDKNGVNQVNFNKLRYVIVVAQEKSITKAAKKLYISQPSLSQCIRSIEEDIGTELFIRSKSSISLTPAGEAYVEWAKATIESAKQLESRLNKIKSGAQRQLDIGASWQRSAALLPEPIDRFYTKVPNCNIRIHEDLNVNLLEFLKNDVIDMEIGVPNPDTVHYMSVPLFQERFLLAASKEVKIPCTEATPFPCTDTDVIRGKPVVILQEHRYLGRVFRQLLTDLNYIPLKITECHNIETLHKLVAKNAGVSLLPEVSVSLRTLPDVNYYTLSDENMGRTVAAVYKKGSNKVDDILKFIDCLKEYLKTCHYPFNVS